MEASLEKPKAESLPRITNNETMEHTESIEETSITDGAQILNAAQASNEGELNPMIFGTREFHAGITAAGVSMHDLHSVCGITSHLLMLLTLQIRSTTVFGIRSPINPNLSKKQRCRSLF